MVSPEVMGSTLHPYTAQNANWVGESQHPKTKKCRINPTTVTMALAKSARAIFNSLFCKYYWERNVSAHVLLTYI